MDAKTFIDEFGRPEAQRIAEKAGTNLAYFSHIAAGRRNASISLAERLVLASDGRLDLLSLMKATPNRSAA